MFFFFYFELCLQDALTERTFIPSFRKIGTRVLAPDAKAVCNRDIALFLSNDSGGSIDIFEILYLV